MAFEVPVDVTRIEALAKAFDSAADAVDRLDTKVQGLNGNMGHTRTLGGRAVALPRNPSDSSIGSGASALGPRNPFPGERDFIGPEFGRKTRPFFEGENGFIGPLRPPSDPEPFNYRGGKSASLDPYDYEGPHQRLARERSMLDRAKNTGDDALIRDWETRVERSQRQVERLDGTRGFGSAVTNALMRSRLNLGPLSPLVMDLVGEAGSTVLGGLGAGIGVMQAGMARMRQDNSAFYTMGGSTANVGAALALGGDNAEARAMQLGDRLREGTVGAGYLRSRGIQFRGRYTDYSGNYVAAIDALRDIPDDQEAVRVARETGLSEDLWLRDVKDRALFNSLKQSRGNAGTVGERKADAEFRAEEETTLNWLGRAAKEVGHTIFQTFFDPANPWGMNTAPDEKKPDNKRPTATGWDRKAERPMSTGPETINGTTAGAIPAGWRGKLLSDVFDNQGIMVGGFSI